jgi:hypothetical protein
VGVGATATDGGAWGAVTGGSTDEKCRPTGAPGSAPSAGAVRGGGARVICAPPIVRGRPASGGPDPSIARPQREAECLDLGSRGISTMSFFVVEDSKSSASAHLLLEARGASGVGARRARRSFPRVARRGMSFRQTKPAVVGDGRDDARSTVRELNALLHLWADYPRVQLVNCADVIPDGTNREHTGVSLEHAHAIAASIATSGFDTEHETPVVVRTPVLELFGSDAFRRWEAFCTVHKSTTPPVANLGDRLSSSEKQKDKKMYTTLGSSHLLIALRLVETNTPSVFPGVKLWNASTQSDLKLKTAIETGLRAAVLRPETPPALRKRVSVLLNKAALEGWVLDKELGEAVLVPRRLGEINASTAGDERRAANADANASGKTLTLFQALSRTLDAEELSSLVRIKHGIDVGRARGGYDDVERVGGLKKMEERDTDAPTKTPKIRARL